MASSRRAAFTIVELLVVIAILGALMAILIPLLGEHHGVARRTDCANRERQVVQAAQLYQADFGSFPGYWMRTSPTNPSGTTWPLALSKYLGRQDVWNVWVKASANQNGADPAKVFGQLYWDQMVCASDPPKTNSGQWLSYGVNCGLYHNNSNSADGVCFNQLSKPPGPTTSTASIPITKGDSYTLFCAENTLGIVSSNSTGWAQATPAGALQYTGFCWQAVTTPNVAQHVNGDKANPNPPMSGAVLGDYARPSSNHPGGVNVTFCDTHYHFLREDVSYYVYQTLMCADPAKADIPPGAIPNGYVLTDGDY